MQPSTNDKKFTTYQRDQESGLDYAMNRYYANTGGRFSSPDKGGMILAKPGSLNRYSYVAADPVNFTDATGNFASPVQCPAGTIPVRDNAGRLWFCYVPPIGGGTGGGTGGEPGPQQPEPQGPTPDPWEEARETALQWAANINSGAHGKFATVEQSRTLAGILQVVSYALMSTDCASLFGGTGDGAVGNALRQLAVASFSYAANATGIDNFPPEYAASIADLATNPGNTVARTFIGTNIGFVNDNFFAAFGTNHSRGATNIIHELLHMAGFGTASSPGRGDIDTDRNANYAEISRRCGTENPLQ